MKESGRVYSFPPDMHCWPLNTIWMLAHIHKQSQFMIISPIITTYIMREKDKSRYSAFAKEIIVAMKAGYAVTNITYYGYREVTYLTPTKSKEEAVKMTVTDCILDAETCQQSIQHFLDAVTQYRSLAGPDLPKPEATDTFENMGASALLDCASKFKNNFFCKTLPAIAGNANDSNEERLPNDIKITIAEVRFA
jgi:hypothetical protein